jgi:16S rRNA (cytidine1402-2'-O)-methyltransferase
VALVSDAGTPGVSDPGQYLTERCIESGISVVPIPGASSVLSALTKSGFPSDRFVFVGFLPRKGKKRTEALAELAGERGTAIVFESPQRVKKTLIDMDEYIEGRPVALCRELTKMHEECLRGTPRELIELVEGRESLKGEVVLVVSGITGAETGKPDISEDELAARAMEMCRKYPNEKTGALAEILSEETGVKKTVAYRMIVDAKGKTD